MTDGKAIGTYLEQKFQQTLWTKYEPDHGNSAKGIDFPGLSVDVKVTSIKQPQSSCPFKSAREKVYGLGYSLIVFVYEKTDEPKLRTARLDILHSVFIEPHRTGDFQLTRAILSILENKGNAEDLIACMMDKHLPVDEIQAQQLADEILKKPPVQGYLTISNALQWRLQYARIIENAGSVDGIVRIK